MKNIKRIYLILLVPCVVACNWGHENSDENKAPIQLKTEKNDTPKDMQNDMQNDMPNEAKTGVGPIKNKVELGDQIDQEMAAKGEELFNNQCTVCHEIHDSNKGPALGGVLQKRSPQWVMNMILNPDGMIEHNAQAKALKSVYEIKMVDLDLSEKEARQIVEYLRNY